jgi:hypothetical protein
MEERRRLSYYPPMRKIPAFAFFLALAAIPVAAHAHTAQELADEIQSMEGEWEISNSDRDKICIVTLAPLPAPGGMKLQFEPNCTEAFEVTKDITAWKLDKDGLHFMDARGRALIDLDEVEKGIFEGMRPEGRYFVQTLTAVLAEAKPDRVFGEWQVSRGTDEILCVINFLNTPAGENFALALKPGCSALVTNFNPTSWRMEHGELEITSAKGIWRFEEAGEIAWRRIPEGNDPLWLVRQTDITPPEGGG